MATGYSFDGLVRQVNSPVPEPDFYLPLNSDIAIRNGFGDMTYSRASAGDYINKSGLLVKAEANEPRFTQDGLLFERSETNYVVQSEVLQQCTNATSTTENVNGCAEHHITTTGGAISVGWNANTHSASAYTFWNRVQIKILTTVATSQLKFLVTGAGGTGIVDMVVSDNGEITITKTSSGLIATATLIGDGWYQLEATREHTGSSVVKMYSGSGMETGIEFLIRQPQSNTHQALMSYIPTLDEPVTRAEDRNFGFPTMGNVPPHWSTGVTVYVERFICPSGYGDQVVVWPGLSISSHVNMYRFLIDNSHSKKAELSNNLFGGAYQWQKLKEVYRYDPYRQTIDMWINGRHNGMTGVIADPQDYSAAHHTTFIGCASNGPNRLTAHVRNFKIWNHPLTDAQIANLGGQ